MNRRAFALSTLTSLIGLKAANGEGPAQLPNLQMPTAGGLHWWGDVLFRSTLRIQRNILTGHYRLLDEYDTRYAWGTLDACQAKLEEIATKKSLPQLEGTAVVLLHGLNRNRRHMRRMGEHLQKIGGYSIVNVGYPSSRAGVDKHAEQLQQVMDGLTHVKRVHFVAHSLGNLVVRRWLTMNTDETGQYRDKRVGRIVMLGPPNHSPIMAKILVPVDLKNAIGGQAGRDMQSDWPKLEPNLATPQNDFGIIAGGKSNGDGWNFLIPGDDDILVGVNETKLDGAADFRVIRVLHANMPYNEGIWKLTHHFFENGRFASEEERQRLG